MTPLWYALAFYCMGTQTLYLQVGPFPTSKRCQDVQTFLAVTTCGSLPATPLPDRYPCWSIPNRVAR